MEDTGKWLKNKITPNITENGIKTEKIKHVIKKEVKVKKGNFITIPNKAVIGELFKVSFDKEYPYISITISNGIRMEVPNAVWNAGGKEEEVGTPLIDFLEESDTKKWGSVEVPMKAIQRVHGKEINILKPEEILVEITVKTHEEEHHIHEKIQLVEN